MGASRRAGRWLALVAGAWLAAPAAASDLPPELVLLRGTPGLGSPTFELLAEGPVAEVVASCAALAAAAPTGTAVAALAEAVQGRDVAGLVALYRAAQVAGGRAAERTEPLFVALDPADDWARAWPWTSFSFRRAGRSVRVNAPLLALGERLRPVASTDGGTPASREQNRRFALTAEAFWTPLAGRGAPRRRPDFARDVLGAGGRAGGLAAAAATLPHAAFVQLVESALLADLRRRGLDAARTWSEHLASAGPATEARQARAAALGLAVAETLAHEAGHLLHFVAQGPQGWPAEPDAPHVEPLRHGLTTLSTPSFAFMEGLAIAAARVSLQLPEELSPGDACRSDYHATATWVQRRLARDPGVPPPADAAEEARLVRADRYLRACQDRRGQARARYDFLRSEYAVAATLQRLHRAAGPEGATAFLATLARRKPRDLASALEALAHDEPGRCALWYRELARATEGILVTPAQAEFAAAQAAAGRPFELDLDRDGALPGLPAAAAAPALFPPEPPPLPDDPDPLGPPSGARPAAGPPAGDAAALNLLAVTAR